MCGIEAKPWRRVCPREMEFQEQQETQALWGVAARARRIFTQHKEGQLGLWALPSEGTRSVTRQLIQQFQDYGALK